MRIIRNLQSPAGLTRLLLRLPIILYRLRLGWLFGHRLLLVHHVGRITGKRRRTVLEVAEHCRLDNSWVVASGWGPTAEWYQNIRNEPHVRIQIATRTIPVTAVPVDVAEAADIFLRYASRHRAAATFMLPRALGIAVDGTDADFQEVGRHLPFIRFVARATE
jgi:deazaflavin-dependent oxidoreductase (nitroreductase family)